MPLDLGSDRRDRNPPNVREPDPECLLCRSSGAGGCLAARIYVIRDRRRRGGEFCPASQPNNCFIMHNIERMEAGAKLSAAEEPLFEQ
jgi:hypothetical protein